MPSQILLSKTREGDTYHLKYKICISGSAETDYCAPGTVEKAEIIGRLVAENNMILVTGATTGIPYWAAKGAKEAGGIVIGISPAASKAVRQPVRRTSANTSGKSGSRFGISE